MTWSKRECPRFFSFFLFFFCSFSFFFFFFFSFFSFVLFFFFSFYFLFFFFSFLFFFFFLSFFFFFFIFIFFIFYFFIFFLFFSKTYNNSRFARVKKYISICNFCFWIANAFASSCRVLFSVSIISSDNRDLSTSSRPI
jgi:hypothetical protein